MRIAVTALGKDLDAEVDPRFGRARYILILSSDGTIDEVIDNGENINAMHGAGIQAGKTLADKKVEVLLTGHCGPNAFRALLAAGIKVGTEQQGKVSEALARLNRDEVTFADAADVDAHW